jgi:hypothetical protein
MQLRKCCNHPFLLNGVEAEVKDQQPDTKTVDLLVNASGKFVLLDKLLPRLKADGHRILLFSQFKIMLDIIEVRGCCNRVCWRMTHSLLTCSILFALSRTTFISVSSNASASMDLLLGLSARPQLTGFNQRMVQKMAGNLLSSCFSRPVLEESVLI